MASGFEGGGQGLDVVVDGDTGDWGFEAGGAVAVLVVGYVDGLLCIEAEVEHVDDRLGGVADDRRAVGRTGYQFQLAVVVEHDGG